MRWLRSRLCRRCMNVCGESFREARTSFVTDGSTLPVYRATARAPTVSEV